MVAKSFEVNDLVWAKMKGYPPWPGKIILPPGDAKSPKVKKAHHYVYFYGSENHAWIPDENILLHNDRLVQEYATKKRPASYLSAVETIVNVSKNSTKYQKQHESNFEKHTSEDASPKFQKPLESSFERLKDVSPKNKSSHANSVITKDIKRKVPKKVVKKRALSSDRNNAECSSFSLSPKAQRIDEEYASLFANIPPNIGFPDGDTHNSPSGLLSRNAYIECPEAPPMDLTSINEVLRNKDIHPTSKKIGFLGMGKMGQGIVKNLLQSGHAVTVWNRSSERCRPFINIGAKVAETPADVVLATDIIFCCVSDPDAAKTLVFGNCGILKGLEQACSGSNKGYVEMTSMDPKTSMAIAEQVTLKGGRYLEAPLSGSRIQAIEGTLSILGAGDSSLSSDCESCFHAIARHYLFLEGGVGCAAQFNIIHSMLVGTVYAALAESLALIRRVGLEPGDFLDILQHGVLDSKNIIEKGRAMIQREYTSNTPLKHMQKDLSLGLMLGSSVEQPMPITAAANEVYKHCKLLRYADHDVSAVYEGTSA